MKLPLEIEICTNEQACIRDADGNYISFSVYDDALGYFNIEDAKIIVEAVNNYKGII